MTTQEQGRLQVGKSVTIGNFISPLLTVLALGIPALIWAGKIDTRVEGLKSDITAVRADMTSIQTSANALSSGLVTMNITITEGLKTGMAELQRRIVSLEQRNDRQQDEINRLQIELATIKRASEPPGRRP